ncbi:MAG: mechanosensitive ion channel family protein [Nanoarchaeota archaeon]
MIKKLKNLIDFFLLKSFKITWVHKKQTYFFFILLIVMIILRIFYSDYLIYPFLFSFLDLLLIFFSLNIFFNIVKIILISSYRKRNNLPVDHYDNLTIGLSSIINIILIISLFTAILFYFRVEIKSFLTIIGIFSAGFAWVFKEHIINVVNGLIIMFSKNLTIGDYILINNYKGIIIDITFLYTEIKTDQGNLTYIPNNLILANEVVNYSKINLKRIIFNFDLSSSNFNKIEKIEKKLIHDVEIEFPNLVKEINITIGKLKSKSANLIVEINASKYNFSIEKQLKDFVKRKIINYVSK